MSVNGSEVSGAHVMRYCSQREEVHFTDFTVLYDFSLAGYIIIIIIIVVIIVIIIIILH